MNKFENLKEDIQKFQTEFLDTSLTVNLQTSGSTGSPKTIKALKKAMLLSAQRTNNFIGLQPGDTAIICLPIHYIAGKMMVVRAIERQLNIIPLPPVANPLLTLEAESLPKKTALLAITPQQLHAIINHPESRNRLCHISHTIVGGAAIPPNVEQQIIDLPGNIYATYGMTETLSHIALRKLNGPERSELFCPLNDISIRKTSDGTLAINDPQTNPCEIITNDLVEIAPNGLFRILGRKDNVVNSGGIKLQLEELEQRLTSLSVSDYILTYVNHEQYGQALTLLYTGEVNVETINLQINELLSSKSKPKYIFKVNTIPRTQTGKPARNEAHILAEHQLQTM